MKDITGNKYGRWTVLGFKHKDKDSKTYWKCKCECEREYIVRTDRLIRGKSLSCLHCRTLYSGEIKCINKYIEYDTYFKCIVSNGKSFLIDKDDYEVVNKINWTVSKNNVVASKNYLLHRYLLNIKDKSLVIDHINHNPKDNRKSNLRICTAHQNAMNCSIPINNTSGYKGVSWSKQHSKWISYIKYKYKKIHIGLFNNKIDAAIAYNDMAKKLFGQFACLNKI